MNKKRKPWVLSCLYPAISTGSVAEAAGFQAGRQADRPWSLCSFHKDSATHTAVLYSPLATSTHRGYWISCSLRAQESCCISSAAVVDLALCFRSPAVLSGAKKPAKLLFSPTFISEGRKKSAVMGRVTNGAQGSVPIHFSNDTLSVSLTY